MFRFYLKWLHNIMTIHFTRSHSHMLTSRTDGHSYWLSKQHQPLEVCHPYEPVVGGGVEEAEHQVLVPAAGEAGPSQAAVAVEEGDQGGAQPSLLHTVTTGRVIQG